MLIRLDQGFHGGAGVNVLDDWTTWWQSMHTAGLPVNAIFTDNAGPLFEIQESNFPGDTLVWRRSLWHNGFDPNNPDYTKEPEAEAVRMLSYKYNYLWPSELNRHRVWLKDTNEIRTQSNPGDVWYNNLAPGEWWGRYGLTAAKWAVNNNVRVILLSPSSGDHTYNFWSQPSMLAFLSYAASNKENVMLGLHEYSYVPGNLFALPDNDNATILDLLAAPLDSRRAGRFELVFKVMDDNKIGDWPNLYFCEWGWAERDMPQTQDALNQIVIGTQDLYGAYYKYIKGFGTWYLGSNYGTTIARKTNSLLLPTADISRSRVFTVVERTPDQGGIIVDDCGAIVDVRTISLWIPDYEKMTQAELTQAYAWARYGFKDNNGVQTPGKHMLCPSHVDALRIHTQGLPGSILGIAYPEKIGSGVTEQWLLDNCPCVYNDDKQVVFLPHDDPDDCENCLPIELFSQRDPRWSGIVLGQNTGHDKTIGNWGCLLTAYNMFANYWKLCTDNPGQFNTRLVNAGAFSAQYIQPGALKTAFPNDVEYYGYLGRGDALNARVREYIDNKIPVPARVDFIPNTSQWDQHWVLVIGYSDTDFYVADPWYGDKVWLSKRYAIAGNDLLEGLFYKRRVQPVQSSKFGLHLRADPTVPSAAEYNEQEILLDAGGKTVKLMHNHPETVFHRVGNMRPQTAVVRIFQSWGNRNITPQQFHDWNYQELINRVSILKAYGVEPIIEVHNEPNLVSEGWTYSWNNGFDFAIWLSDVLGKFKAHPELATLKFIYPGLSPGGTTNVRYNSALFLNDSLSVRNLVHGFGVHAYWSQGWPMQTAIDHVNATKAVTGKPVYVTECSINDRPAVLSNQQYGENYARFIKSVSTEGIYFYVGSASDLYFAPETWVTESGVSKGIAGYLANSL